ncbi:MAG: hypothetical protein ACREV5_08180, partial [Steroidobacter sp.]
MNNSLIVAIVAASLLSGCSGRPSADGNAREAALASDVEASGSAKTRFGGFFLRDFDLGIGDGLLHR